MIDPPLRSRLIDKSPIHYAWVVLVAGTIGTALTIPGQTVGVSVFLDFIIDDLGLGRSAVTLIAYGLLFGTMQGMSGAITATVYPHYFGRTHQGAIKGVVTTIGVAGTAAGPLLLALGFGASGSYRPVLTVAALVPAAIALFAFSVRLVTPGGVR